MDKNRIVNLYIDDTGTKEREHIDTPYFAYAGIIVAQKWEQAFIDKLLELKMSYFGDTPELKSRSLRMPEQRDKYYIKPYGITSEKLDQFVAELFRLIASQPIRCLGAIVDKERHTKHYKRYHFDPSAVCYEFLLQRVANFCNQYKIDQANIILDDMSGKNRNGSEWKKLLDKQHKSLKAGKSQFYKNWKTRSGMDYSRISESIEFRDSKDDQLIQIADLCAYNIYGQARLSWNDFDTPPFYKGYGWIKDIMHRHPKTKRITSNGVVCFPTDKIESDYNKGYEKSRLSGSFALPHV